MLQTLFNYFIFPGFVFTAACGMLVSWFDRKITARLQWRKGPSIFQSFFDIIKLFLKETVIPSNGNTFLFVVSPLVSLLTIVLVSNILILAWLDPYTGFIGDLIVVFYLLTIPALMSILGASASNNPFASLGASREIKLMLGYELPLVLSILVTVIKSGKLSLNQIVYYQQIYGSINNSISGVIAFIIAVICIQGKMGLVPFDLGESETEIAGGTQIEYSGPLLAAWKLNKMMMQFVAPIFLIIIFWAGGNEKAIILKFFLIVILSILIKNTNPRLRIDQAMKFFWGPMTVLGIVAIIFAWIGL